MTRNGRFDCVPGVRKYGLEQVGGTGGNFSGSFHASAREEEKSDS